MKRREFITLVGGAAAWPLAVRAQQPAMLTIGVLTGSTVDSQLAQLAGFREGLKESGFVEGQDVAIEYRSAEGQTDRLPALAARHKLPAVYYERFFAAAGGLIFLRVRFYRPIPALGILRRSHPEGREARRPAGAGADQV